MASIRANGSPRVVAARTVFLSAYNAWDKEPTHATAERLREAERQMQTALRYPIGDPE